ncbi:MAG: hypothetical protein ABFD07_10195 [Methanobacterium sp.]
MKVPHSIKQLYDDQVEIYNRLKEKFDARITNLKDSKWHYESRVKTLESYALKLETGRFDPRNLEDFFACTLVVENFTSVKKAEQFIEKEFSRQYRRPKRDNFTHKKSDSFPFDDLRLYATWKDDSFLPPTTLENILFEVQIKTFLQHAWGIATHDFVYKNDSMNWGKERIAYQIKAMLEHAELSILEADKIAESSVLNKTNGEMNNLSKLIEFLKYFWSDQDLPSDIVRLSKSINLLIYKIGIDIETLKSIILEETNKGKGAKLERLSPYGIILQSLFNCREDLMCRWLSMEGKKFKVLITDELDLPQSLQKENIKNAIII